MTARPDLFRQLDLEWGQLVATPQMHRFVAELNRQHSGWRFITADDVVAAARIDPDDGTPSVLAHLVGATIAGDDLAYRTAIQAMLPRWWTIAASLSGIPIADAVDLVVSVGTAQIRTCDPATASTPMGWRLWCNTRRTAIRRIVRFRNDQVATVLLRPCHDLAVEDHYPRTELEDTLSTHRLRDQLQARVMSTGLVGHGVAVQVAADVQHQLSTDDGWVLNEELLHNDARIHRVASTINGHLARQLRRRIESTGFVDEAMTELIVDTRVLGQRLCDRAAEYNVAVSTLRKRRQRAERQLRRALTG